MDYGDSMDNDRLSAVSAIALHALLGGAPKFTQDILAGGFRSAREVFSFDREHGGRFLEAFRRRAGVPDEDALFRKAEREYGRLGGEGCRFVSIFDACYPALLRDCPDAPLLLYVRSVSSPEEVFQGTPGRGAGFPISVVGTRDMSPYGRHWCRETVRALADTGATPTIVSGLAFGIDITAHRAALEYGLESIAVLPCGIDMVYPAAHREDAARIARQGMVITEFATGTKPLKIHFIKRNRIIAGLSRCTVVVESRRRGGAMSTVEFALSYNRDVYAVPGRIFDVNSYGCNYLISKNMASIYNGPDEKVASKRDLFSGSRSGREKILLALKNKTATDMETICRKTGLDFSTVSTLLLEMELEGVVLSLHGNNYKLA